MAASSKATMRIAWRDEIDLILCCAHARVDETAAERIQLLASSTLDWEYVMKTAYAHGVMPLLYRSLKTACSDEVPIKVRTTVREAFDSHVQRNLLLTGELLRILRLLKSHNISALPYKGPVLAASVYGDISLRSFSDLDILVDKADIPKAKDLILSQGYRHSKPLTPGQEAARLKSKQGKDFAFIDSRDVKLELHWELATLALFPLETRGLWDRLEPLEVGGMTVLNLAPEDLLLTLCVHGAKHFFKRLEWICDISELIAANPKISWETVLQRATQLHSLRMLFLGLILARDLLGTSLPETVLSQMRADRQTGQLAERVQQTLFCNEEFSDDTKRSETLKRDVHVIGLRERKRDRFFLSLYYFRDYVQALVTPNEEDESFFKLPASFRAFYYILRPIRLITAYGLSWLSFKRRRKS